MDVRDERNLITPLTDVPLDDRSLQQEAAVAELQKEWRALPYEAQYAQLMLQLTADHERSARFQAAGAGEVWAQGMALSMALRQFIAANPEPKRHTLLLAALEEYSDYLDRHRAAGWATRESGEQGG